MYTHGNHWEIAVRMEIENHNKSIEPIESKDPFKPGTM